MRFPPAENRKVTRLLRGERGHHGLQGDEARRREAWRPPFMDEYFIKTKEMIRVYYFVRKS
jgi:hypothetical protein